MGLDGNNSWGAHTLDKYSLLDREYGCGFTLRPYTPGADRLDELVGRGPHRLDAGKP